LGKKCERRWLGHFVRYFFFCKLFTMNQGQAFYEKAKECELAGDFMGAIKWYKKAERLGHSLCDAAPTASVDYEQNQVGEFEYRIPEFDSEGFVISFTVDQTEEISEFFAAWGFVVVRDVLNSEEIKETISEIWSEIQMLSLEQQGLIKNMNAAHSEPTTTGFWSKKNKEKGDTKIEGKGKEEEGKIEEKGKEEGRIEEKGKENGEIEEKGKEEGEVEEKGKKNGEVEEKGKGNGEVEAWLLGEEDLAEAIVFYNLPAVDVDSDDVVVPLPDDPLTWQDELWTRSAVPAGLLGTRALFGPCAMRNRQNVKVYKAFCCVFGCEELYVNLGRFGVMRPTRDHPQWRTMSRWFHWDLNPWGWFGLNKMVNEEAQMTDLEKINVWDSKPSAFFIPENNLNSLFHGYEKVQGLIALEDSKETDGGFQCVPGFQKILKHWAENTEEYSSSGLVDCPTDDTLANHGVKITMRKGSIVIWNSCLPHCNFPNEGSHSFRMCQYLRMCPAVAMGSEPEGVKEARKRAVVRCLRHAQVEEQIKSHLGIHSINKSFELSPLGEKLFGLLPWTDEPSVY